MSIPKSVVDKLNSTLGIKGRPHRILIQGQWINTGCLEWSKTPSVFIGEFKIWPIGPEQMIDPSTIEESPSLLKRVRGVIMGEPVIAYRNGIIWEDMTDTSYDCIVVAPSIDQFDSLRFEQTDGVNRGLQTEDVIDRLKKIDEKHGIDITAAASDGLEFTLKRIPIGLEIHELRKMLMEFCPDLRETPRGFPKGKITLWWD